MASHHHPSALRNRGPIAEVLKLALLGGDARPRTALEVGSSTGAHLELFAETFPSITWQPSEYVPPPSSSSSSLSPDEQWAKYGKISGDGHNLNNNSPLHVLDSTLLPRFARNVKPAVALDLTVAADADFPFSRSTQFDLIHAGNILHVAPFPSATSGLFRLAQCHLAPSHSGGLLTLYGPFKRRGELTSPGDAEFDAKLRSSNSEFGIRDVESDILPIAAQHGLQLLATISMPANNLLLVFSKM